MSEVYAKYQNGVLALLRNDNEEQAGPVLYTIRNTASGIADALGIYLADIAQWPEGSAESRAAIIALAIDTILVCCEDDRDTIMDHLDNKETRDAIIKHIK